MTLDQILGRMNLLIQRREFRSDVKISFSELEALVLLVRHVEMQVRKDLKGRPGPNEIEPT